MTTKEKLIKHEEIYTKSSDLEADLEANRFTYDRFTDDRFTDVTLNSSLHTAQENRITNQNIQIIENDICCDDVCRNYYIFLLKFNLGVGLLALVIYLIVTISLKKIPFQ